MPIRRPSSSRTRPSGKQYTVMPNGMRITGGSMSVRYGYMPMRRIGALARRMLLQAGAQRLGVPVDELTTEPGKVVHKTSGKSLTYGEIAPHAMDLPVPDPDSVKLKDPDQFRWIGKPVKRVDAHDKSTGKVQYTIDTHVEGMLQAAVQHAPRLGMTVGSIRNEAKIKAMKGVHSVHVLPGAVAVVAERWWHAKRAAEAAKVDWKEPKPDPSTRHMPADFSTKAFRERLANEPRRWPDGRERGPHRGGAEERAQRGQRNLFQPVRPPRAAGAAFDAGTLQRRRHAGNLAAQPGPGHVPGRHRQDRPGSTRTRSTCTRRCWVASSAGISCTVRATPTCRPSSWPRQTGRPVKLIWSREEEFLRDPMRPMAVVRFRGGLDADGMPVALEAVSATEGPTESLSNKRPKKVDDSAVEGLTGKVVCHSQPPYRPAVREDPGDAGLLALGGPFDERLLLRDVPRRDWPTRAGRIPSSCA